MGVKNKIFPLFFTFLKWKTGCIFNKFFGEKSAALTPTFFVLNQRKMGVSLGVFGGFWFRALFFAIFGLLANFGALWREQVTLFCPFFNGSRLTSPRAPTFISGIFFVEPILILAPFDPFLGVKMANTPP